MHFTFIYTQLMTEPKQLEIFPSRFPITFSEGPPSIRVSSEIGLPNLSRIEGYVLVMASATGCIFTLPGSRQSALQYPRPLEAKRER